MQFGISRALDLPGNSAALVIEVLPRQGLIMDCSLCIMVRYKYCDNTFRYNPYHHWPRNRKLMAGYNWITIEP